MLRDADSSFEVTEVATAEAALERVSTDEFDLVLSDFNLPGRTGAELAEAIRKLGVMTPVIIVTGSTSVAAAEGSFGVGAVAFLSKESLDAEALQEGIQKSRVIRHTEIDLKSVPVDTYAIGQRLAERLLIPIETLENDMRVIRERPNRSHQSAEKELAAIDDLEAQIVAINQKIRAQISNFRRELS